MPKRFKVDGVGGRIPGTERIREEYIHGMVLVFHFRPHWDVAVNKIQVVTPDNYIVTAECDNQKILAWSKERLGPDRPTYHQLVEAHQARLNKWTANAPRLQSPVA
jgi:hypothetical protein